MRQESYYVLFILVIGFSQPHHDVSLNIAGVFRQGNRHRAHCAIDYNIVTFPSFPGFVTSQFLHKQLH